MEMAWTGLLDESFSSFRAILNGGGEYDFYSTMDANEMALEALLGSSLMCPDGSVLSNVQTETIDAFHHMDCSITTIAEMLEHPNQGSDELGLLQRRAEIESGFHKNEGSHKLNGMVGGSRGNASHAANNNNNNGYASAASVGRGRGRKTGLPAKNLMAERRRRKKVNDRLFMLRSVVPKVSKVTLFLSLVPPTSCIPYFFLCFGFLC